MHSNKKFFLSLFSLFFLYDLNLYAKNHSYPLSDMKTANMKTAKTSHLFSSFKAKKTRTKKEKTFWGKYHNNIAVAGGFLILGILIAGNFWYVNKKLNTMDSTMQDLPDITVKLLGDMNQCERIFLDNNNSLIINIEEEDDKQRIQLGLLPLYAPRFIAHLRVFADISPSVFKETILRYTNVGHNEKKRSHLNEMLQSLGKSPIDWSTE
jgi:hypothetical protein